jgi:hypothetical protein
MSAAVVRLRPNQETKAVSLLGEHLFPSPVMLKALGEYPPLAGRGRERCFRGAHRDLLKGPLTLAGVRPIVWVLTL